jgi:hypothetical protein
MRRIGILGLIATLALAASLGTAGAHSKKFATEVQVAAYSPSEHAFLGNIGSLGSRKCAGGRLITLWRRNPGAQSGPFGTAKSAKGQWRIDVNAPPGTYYATVGKKVIRNNSDHKHVCKADTSPDLVVGP